MSVTRRTRSAARRAMKTQRRIALAQFLFWPAVLTVGALLGGSVLAAVSRGANRQPGA